MYISKEQAALEKIDEAFVKLVKRAEKRVGSTIKENHDRQKYTVNKELPKVQKPTFKSNRLKVENGVLVESTTLSETVFIPEGVTEIGNEVFKNSKHLHLKIIFPDGLKKIGVAAFEAYEDIMEMDVKDPDLCYYQGIFKNDEFGQCSRGFSQFPSTLEEIGDNAFRGFGHNMGGYSNRLMEYLILPQSLKRLGKGAFMKSGIRAAYIAGPQTISELCFSKSGLRKVIFGDEVKSIDKIAFDGCNRLEKIIFGKNLNEIGEYAFAFCIALRTIVFPESLKKIGKGAFCDCGLLASVEIPDSVSEIGEKAFLKCKSLQEVKLGTGITTIPEWCFSSCKKLEKITIPDSVTSIANSAFKNSDKVVIYASTGSYAERYSKENGIQFESTTEPRVLNLNCPNCGTQLMESCNFCHNCGEKILK